MYSTQSWLSGRLLAHPVDLVVGHAAKPVGLEAEQIAVERVLDSAAMHQDADVNDVAADGVGSIDRLEACGGLHELNLVALGVERL